MGFSLPQISRKTDGNGLNFVDYLKSNFPCIKIIMCTADDLEFQAKGKVEIHNYLQKPFKIQELKVIINNLNDLPRCSKTEKCYRQECSRSLGMLFL